MQKDIRLNVIVVDSERKLSLGDLRNISIAETTGDFFCQWDDDDWYHPNRIEFQLEEILKSNKIAFCLADGTC